MLHFKIKEIQKNKNLSIHILTAKVGKMNSLIRLDNIWKIYGFGEARVEALRGLNLNVKEGEFLAILGPSGSGKSTAMNMIGALDTPTKGKMLLDGEDVSNLDENELAIIRGKKIGFIFQSFNLIPTLTALENVALPLLFQHVSRTESLERAANLLENVGLGKRLDHRPAELSGGEQQRVAVARALVNDPPIILADEPTGNLDSKTSLEIMKLLQKLNKKGKTIVYITHNRNLTKFADRTVNITDGKIRSTRR